MVADLVRKYSSAGVSPPQLLYVDTDCCKDRGGETKLKQRFGGWLGLVVGLDIYHFMRRLASGCTNDAHPLYPTFMAKLSCCIFEWDSSDVALLQRVKREKLRREGVPGITDKLVDQQITKKDVALYCRRRTREEVQTVLMIEQLLNELMEVKGRDLLGVSLFDQERMQHIWRVQKRHVKCIQNQPGELSSCTPRQETPSPRRVLSCPSIGVPGGRHRWNPSTATCTGSFQEQVPTASIFSCTCWKA